MSQVRLFAALRDAAGTGRLTSDAPDVPTLLDELRGRFGEPFTSRLEVATVIVDGEPVDRAERRALSPASEVALLPPFSGGA
ncbi:MAG: MoaD/ThiS family protein [Actinobacteria bacterium]|nr:MoaD/ThiS family protein [Actinomycetota bacterium]